MNNETVPKRQKLRWDFRNVSLEKAKLRLNVFKLKNVDIFKDWLLKMLKLFKIKNSEFEPKDV